MGSYNPFQLGNRNSAAGLAHRAMKNLENIERTNAAGGDVHVVTQLVMSLQAIVVFPWEHGDLRARAQEPLALTGSRWILRKDTYDKKCTSLHALLKHVRNALSHRRLVFSSDSRDISGVEITFSDRKHKKTGKLEEWEATILGQDLRDFCAAMLKKLC